MFTHQPWEILCNKVWTNHVKLTKKRFVGTFTIYDVC